MSDRPNVRILVVDDDAGIALLLRRALEAENFLVDVAPDGLEGERRLLEQDYDVALLDFQLPYRTGLEILTALRQAGRPTLVLMLTVRHGESEVVAGLDAGADDYIGKPFSVVELVARVRALLRRRREPAGDILEFGGIRMDRAQRRVEIDGHAIQLTPREYELLEYLLRRPNRVVSRGELLERVWGIRFHPGTNVLDVHVSNVRRKLNAHAPRARIRTERGVGFALAVS